MATRQDRHYGRVRPGGHGIPFGQTALTGQRLGFSVLRALAMTLSPFPAKRNGGGDFVIAGGIGNTAPRKSRQHRNRGNSQEQATSESRQLARAGNNGQPSTIPFGLTALAGNRLLYRNPPPRRETEARTAKRKLGLTRAGQQA